MVGGAVATADWPEDTLAEAAGEGFSTATGVADLLAANGLPFRTAHEVVAIAAEEGSDLDAVDAAAREVLDAPLAEYVDPEAVEGALDPAESVASRDSVGGPAASAVEAYIADAEDRLATDRDALADRRNALATAAALLDDEVSSYA